MTKTCEIDITGIAAGGAGVGRLPDGRAVFVHRTAPGEKVAIRVTASRARWARGRLLRVLAASPDRRRPPCQFYDRCGGCTLEHVHYAAQLRAKSALVSEALRRIGDIEAPAHEVVASPQEFRYRNRISVALERLGDGRVVAGFHELERAGRIVDITRECLLPEAALADVWARLRREWGRDASRLPSGDRLRLTLRVTAAGAASLVVEGGYSAGRPEELLLRVPSLVAVWQRRNGEKAARLLAGAPLLAETWGETELELSGDTFLQVNRGAATALERYVVELAGEVGGRRIVDAYCGMGTVARRLAGAGALVTGIELDVRAVEAARAGAPAGAEFIVGRVEARLAEALPAELVLLNPPRGGLDAAVPRLLLDQAPGRIIYVSCDPATLARDLARLSGTFRLRSLRCFDLFPQTAHIETVAELVCATT